MKIINPIYDNAFKYLMDNEQIAKIILSIILDKKIISLQSKPQETPILKANKINLSRFDFKAIISDNNGDTETILIELQKYRAFDYIGRFRQYLAENYMKKENFINIKGKDKQTYLPITAIYILGFNIDNDIAAIKSEPRLFDVLNNNTEIINKKYNFFNLLTHNLIVLQPNVVLPEDTDSRLSKFINLFVKKLEDTDSNYIIDIDETNLLKDKDFNQILNYLNQATLDDELLRTLKYEKEYNEGIENVENNLNEERRQKEEERRQKEEIKYKLANKMKKYGESIDEIIKETNLTKEEIDKL